MYDVVIIGGGPAGLTAAIYLARAKMKCIVLEKNYFGGQIAITNKVENYPGIPEISGMELTQNMHKQGEKFGAEYSFENAVRIMDEGDCKIVKTNKREIKCKAVIIATGAKPKEAGFKGEKEFTGRGVSYCATCDGRFFADKEVFVVGAGYSACQESLYLAKIASKVTMILRKDKFKNLGAIVAEVMNHPKIEVCFNSKIIKVDGNSLVENVWVQNLLTKEERKYTSEDGFGVFVFVGYDPCHEIAPENVEKDENNYIANNIYKMTNVPGIYAVGDVAIKDVRQVVTAASDGAIAAKAVESELLKI